MARLDGGGRHREAVRFSMNGPGIPDRALETWLDRTEAVVLEGLRFRDVDSFAIEGRHLVAFSAGGADE